MKTTAAKTTDSKSSSASNHARKGQESAVSKAVENDQAFFKPTIQAKLTIGQPNDKFEKEADAVADKIVNSPESSSTKPPFFTPSPSPPQVNRQEEEQLKSKEENQPSISLDPIIQREEEENLQRKPAFESPGIMDLHSSRMPEGGVVQSSQKSNSPKSPNKSFTNQLNTSKGGGQPLSQPTKNKMESGFGTDFSNVRVHNDKAAQNMNQDIGARAFTHGNDIYFNQGQYNPGSRSGDHLLAHELTHTIQQGASVSPKLLPKLSYTDANIQGNFIRDIIDNLVDALDFLGFNIPEIIDHVPGYTLFTAVIEYDIIRGRSVERNARSLVRGLMGLVPGGELLYQKLNENGAIDRALEWVEGELARFDLSLSRVERLFGEAWDEMGISLGLSGNLRVLSRKFGGLLDDIEGFADSLVDQLIEFLKESLIRPMVEFLEERSDAVSLAYKVIGRKFPLDDEVNAPTEEILADFLILIGKETELEQMRERGTLAETAEWIDTQIFRFNSLVGRFQTIFTRVWDAFSIDKLSDIPGEFQAIFDDFMDLLQDFFDFALEVALKVLEFVKKALLDWLNSFAAEIPGFTLLTVIIRKNPLTDEPVPRTVQNLIRGFMGLIPGGERKYQEMTESGVIPRAAGQIEALMEELGISWAFVKGLFTEIWESFSIDDLLDPIGAFQRVTERFGEPISRLFTFVVKVVRILVELLLEIMGIPPELIANIITNAMSAFEDIKNDPIGFLLNLMNAVKDGFLNFLNNIGTHLLNGLQTWLFGTLADAGVTIPEDLSLRSILGMAMEILGITVDNILDRLALQIGEERVAQIREVLDTLTGIWAFIKDVMERGPIAIWEYIETQINNLWNIIQDGIMGFIQEKVIQQAITWLLSFLDVTGIMPIIRGVQSVFNAVQSFIEKLREILEIINSFVAGVADIARGNITAAANFLEQALADGIPVAISFLAKQLGLGDISEKIQEMIEAAREKINEAIDWLIEQALRAGTAFLNALGLGGGSAADNEEEEEEDVDPEVALQISEALATIPQKESGRLEEGKLSQENAEAVAAEIRQEYSIFTTFEVVDGGDSWDYHYVANPDRVFDDQRPEKVGSGSASNRRLEEKRNILTGAFSRSDYQSSFEPNISNTTALGDLQLGVEQGIVTRIGEGSSTQYSFSVMSEEEIIQIGTRETLSNGRNNGTLNSEEGFTWENIQNFLLQLEQLPSSNNLITQEVSNQVINNLINEGEVIRVDGQGLLFTFSQVPSQRLLPESWKTSSSGSGRSASADNVRLKYYLNGASPSWNSAKQQVIERDQGLIESAINNIESNIPASINMGRNLWVQLRQNKIVPDEDYKTSEEGGGLSHYLGLERQVDHEPPMATHWKQEGYNQSWSSRQNYATDVDQTLTYILKSENQQKLANGDHYTDKWFVGPDFTGPGQQGGGPQWADVGVYFENMKNYSSD